MACISLDQVRVIVGHSGIRQRYTGIFLVPLPACSPITKRQRILAITQGLAALQAFILAVLVITDQAEVWHVVLLGALLGVINAFDIPARQAFLVEVVESKEDLGNAIALNSFVFNGALLIGPVMAGVLIAFFGEGLCLILNGVSYLALIGALLLMKIPKRKTSSGNIE
jgi:MFS family permease